MSERPFYDYSSDGPISDHLRMELLRTGLPIDQAYAEHMAAVKEVGAAIERAGLETESE